MINARKCGIVGCGFVGATTAYSLCSSALFSELVLVDIDRKKAEGEATDLNHALPFLNPMEIYAGDYSDLADASVIIITAGAAQKSGETRLDLVKKNSRIVASIVKSITAYNREAILLIVSNPVDVLTYTAWKVSGLDRRQVIGSGTVLDTARLKYLVGDHFGVDFRNVHTFVLGEHGDTEFPVWSSSNVSGVDLKCYCESCENGCDPALLGKLFEDVRTSAYHIIDAKGATYYAIAEAIRKILSAILRDENSILPVSTMPCGRYGLDNVCLGLPCIMGAGGVKEVLEIPLNTTEKESLLHSANTLKSVIQSLDLEELF